jgi:hypothetical protein
MENARNGDEANGGREEKKKRFRTPDEERKARGSRGGRRAPAVRKARPPESLATDLPHADVFNGDHRQNRHTALRIEMLSMVVARRVEVTCTTLSRSTTQE